MSRQVVLDTETTGLEVSLGHRIIEIGCVELVARRATGRVFHHYVNPERDIDAGAAAVHGITRAKLLGKPHFATLVDEFLAFIDSAELIIHNAPFDLGFLEQELRLAALRNQTPTRRVQDNCTVLDTLVLARELHPGQRNSLDALCKRYAIDSSHRQYHGALLDARILADVYLAMTGGQSALALDEAAARSAGLVPAVATPVARSGGPLRVIAPNADECAAHERLMAIVDKASGGRSLWPAGGK